MRVVVTGGTGFVGRVLISRLVHERRFEVRAATRNAAADVPAGVATYVIAELSPVTSWEPVVAGADIVVHLAARVHVMNDTATNPAELFNRVNALATANLAAQAAAAGVRRFVFLSSIKAGTARDAGEDPYGASKQEAERLLRDIERGTKMEVVVVRPPLVYGPGVKANFRALIRAVSRGIPLPLGSVRNRRSLIGVDNLVDFILTCMEHPAAAGETFGVSDGNDLSTPELIRGIARAMQRPARLIPVPVGLLKAAAFLLGRGDVIDRLLGSLVVDIVHARERLGWKPPVSVDEGLRRAVAEAR